jgi:hypothetical protein
MMVEEVEELIGLGTLLCFDRRCLFWRVFALFSMGSSIAYISRFLPTLRLRG